MEEGNEKLEKVRSPNYGGRREGSGRKPSIKILEDKIRKQLEATFWVDMATKYAEPFVRTVFNEDVPWETRFRTWEALQNRAWGKPTERTEITGRDGKDLIPADEVLSRLLSLKGGSKGV